MSDGVDGGGGENEVDSHSSARAAPGDSSNNREDESLDPDNESALNTNYDSGDGAVPVFRCVSLMFQTIPKLIQRLCT